MTKTDKPSFQAPSFPRRRESIPQARHGLHRPRRKPRQRRTNGSDAIQAINDLPETQVTKQSSLYKTAAMESLPGAPKSPDYINAVVEIICHQPAYLLLEQLQKIEQKAGRIRPYLNAPRTLDLDILLYGDAQIQTETLTIPHPRMWQRAFVLVPLAEIAPSLLVRRGWRG